VVVSHRPSPAFNACLESVVNQADEVLVVDNGSANGEASGLARRAGVRAIRLPRNLGFAGGANAGLAQARAEIVALLNDDAVAGDGWLDAASATLKDATIAAVGPKVLLSGPYLEIILDDDAWWDPGDTDALGRCISSATLGGVDVVSGLVGPGIQRIAAPPTPAADPSLGAPPRPRWRPTARRTPFYVPVTDVAPDAELLLNGERVVPVRAVDVVNNAGCYLRSDGYAGDIGDGEADQQRFNTARDCFSVSGVAFVTTSAALDRVGRLAPRYFAYYEDTDWCWRARLMGLRVVYEPSVTVRHLRGMTSGGEFTTRVQFLSQRNRLITLLRNAPLKLALRETRQKRTCGDDDGVAELLPRVASRALADRAILRRAWKLTPTEVFDRWAGVDVPAAAR
jgi:O-antigen biosynthesis protein